MMAHDKQSIEDKMHTRTLLVQRFGVKRQVACTPP